MGSLDWAISSKRWWGFGSKRVGLGLTYCFSLQPADKRDWDNVEAPPHLPPKQNVNKFLYPVRTDSLEMMQGLNFVRLKWHFPCFPGCNRPAVTALQRADLCLEHTIALISHFTLARGLHTTANNRDDLNSCHQAFFFCNRGYRLRMASSVWAMTASVNWVLIRYFFKLNAINIIELFKPLWKNKNIFTINEKHRRISLQSLRTFMSKTPGREPIRCSMDWTQEPQVIPSTPRETEHRLLFCAMTASSRKTKTKQEWQDAFAIGTLHGFRFKTEWLLRESARKWGPCYIPGKNSVYHKTFTSKQPGVRHIWWSRLRKYFC